MIAVSDYNSIINELSDLFREWSYEDPSVGIFGMSDGETEIASSIIEKLTSERNALIRKENLNKEVQKRK